MIDLYNEYHETNKNDDISLYEHRNTKQVKNHVQYEPISVTKKCTEIL